MAEKEDRRKYNKGHKGSGRKSRAEEQKLVEKLTPLEDEALNVLRKSIKEERRWAVELFFKYFYGLPKQVIDQTVKNDDISIRIVKRDDGDKGDE